MNSFKGSFYFVKFIINALCESFAVHFVNVALLGGENLSLKVFIKRLPHVYRIIGGPRPFFDEDRLVFHSFPEKPFRRIKVNEVYFERSLEIYNLSVRFIVYLVGES